MMSEAHEMTADQLMDVLWRNGFQPCGVPECNCGSWHQVSGWPERFREIDEATEDYYQNDETLLDRVNRIVSSLEALPEKWIETNGFDKFDVADWLRDELAALQENN